jgi:DNA-binding transcriptional LysR family regulator
VSPTEIGLAYYDRARRVLNDAGEADALVTAMQSAPSGTLRVSIATDFGVNHVSPILGRFLRQYPDITVNMELNNRYVELISEGFDMAIRVGELEDSSLRARKICETKQRMIGSPAYFQTYGKPKRIDDLNDHKLLHYSNSSSSNVWKVTAPSGEQRQVRTSGSLTVNDGQSLLNAAIGGLGIAYCRASSMPKPCVRGCWRMRSPIFRSRFWASMRSTRRGGSSSPRCGPSSTSLWNSSRTRGPRTGKVCGYPPFSRTTSTRRLASRPPAVSFVARGAR